MENKERNLPKIPNDEIKGRKNFTLSNKVDNLIGHYSQVEGFKSRSAFIEFLTFEHDAKNDPVKKLKEIEDRINKLERDYSEEIRSLKKVREEVLKKMEMKKEAEKVLKQDKEHALDVLIRAVRRGKTIFELQNFIKTWAYRLGMSTEELSFTLAIRLKEQNLEINKNVVEHERGVYE